MRRIVSVALAGVLACALPAVADHTGLQKGQFQPAVLDDINEDPNVVEVDIEAKVSKVKFNEGKPADVYTYNGSIPGPTIEAEVGNVLVVNFTNNLPEETTIHWHGVETPAEMDGSHISQLTVPPGGTFRYEFTLLDAATYWFHPHVRTNEQVEKGLYGMLVVRDPAEDEALGLPTDDMVLILDDILLDEEGAVAEPFPADPLENAKMQLDGREGNTMLANGREGRFLNVRIGETQRWRVVNSANSTFMRISIPGHTLYRIGGDAGLISSPVTIPPVDMIHDHHTGGMVSNPDPSKGLLLSPGERAEVVFTPCGADGETVEVEWHDRARGRHSPFYKPDGTIGITHDHMDGRNPPQTMFTLRMVGGDEEPVACEDPVLPETLRPVVPVDPTGAATLLVEFGHTPPNADGDVTFFAQRKNGMPLPADAVTPADAHDVFIGETRVWEVANLTGAEHPFHVHGWFFQPYEIQYFDMDNPANNYVVPIDLLENKDTVIVPGRLGARGRSKTVLRAAVHFDNEGREGRVGASGKTPTAESSGGWLFHCHILEHSRRGMLSFFEFFEP